MLEQATKEIVINDHFLPYLENEDRYLVLYGGAGSGKSIFASQKIILRTVSEYGHSFLCLRKVGKTIKDSVFKELKSRLIELDLYDQFSINKTEHKFTHIGTGSEIICTGLDEPEKIKSISGITGMWLEEATEFDNEDFEQLKLRIRGIKEHYVQFILTFNPISENHWLKKWIDSKPENLTFDISTYKDNLFLDEDYKEVLHNLKTTNTLYYDVYVKAKWGEIDKTNKFMFLWNDKFIENVEFNPKLPIWFSFDFNVNPMTCIVGQRINNDTLYVIDQIRMNDSSVYSITDYIKAKYRGYFLVTGDATGRNRSIQTRDKKTSWSIIVDQLNLGDNQINVRSVNLDHISSRILCNAILEHKTIKVNPSCTDLINDCRYATIDDRQKLDKSKDGLHFLDTFRYLLDANFPDTILR